MENDTPEGPTLEAKYDSARKSIMLYLDTQQPRGRGRGVLRRELPISVERMEALLGGRNIEVTLQRTLLCVLTNRPDSGWFNEFAVCTGIVGGVRSAVDLVHVSAEGVWDFVELKEWAAKDEPEQVAQQLLSYYFALSPLVEQRIAPYDRRYPSLVRLWALAPEAYFRQFGGADFFKSRCGVIGQALARVRNVRKEMLNVSFSAAPLVLGGSITKEGFIGMFDRERIATLVQSRQAATGPMQLLLPGKEAMIRSWAEAAVHPLLTAKP